MGSSGGNRGAGDVGSVLAGAVLSRRSFLAVAGLGTLAACSRGPDVPSFTLPGKKLFYGAGMPPDNLAPFETQLGETLPCYRSFFIAGQEAELHNQAKTDLAAGRLPITSIKPPGLWADAARNDAWIDSLLEPLGDIDDQVMLSVQHEPENDSPAYGDASDYQALQSAVLSRAADVARNVVIVPFLSTWSFDARSNRRPSEWNVEDAAVYGVDLYNAWSPTNGKDWVTFGDKLAVAEEEADGRPVVVGEYGCRSDPAQPGRAAQWMHDAFRAALDADVVAMSYFNSYRNSPDGSWELDHETFPVFAELVAEPEVARIRPA
jgi:hypothetical protein